MITFIYHSFDRDYNIVIIEKSKFRINLRYIFERKYIIRKSRLQINSRHIFEQKIYDISTYIYNIFDNDNNIIIIGESRI